MAVWLLAGGGGAGAFGGGGVGGVFIVAQGDLDPFDCAGETAGFDGVVGGGGGAPLVADVGGLVGGEDHGLGGFDATGADEGAVVVDGDVAALGEPAAVVGELDSDLVGAGGDRLVRSDGELLDAEHVVDELGVPVLGV